MILLAILGGTNFLTYGVTTYGSQAKSYVKIVFLREYHQDCNLEKQEQIRAGVAIPNDLLCDNEDTNYEMARTFFPNNRWAYMLTEKMLLPGHQVFVFRLLAKDEKLTLE